MLKTTIKAKTLDLGDVVLGDKLYAVVELEVMDEGRRRNGKDGTVDYRGAIIKDILRLEGDLPIDLANELRRQRRLAESDETGIDVVPGLEGFLDSAGVVVTDADRAPVESITPAALEADELDAVARWVELGVSVHRLRSELVADTPSAVEHQVTLDGLWAELNGITEGDEVVDDDGDTIIIDIEGEVRSALKLPDLEPASAPPDELANADAEEPFAGYDALDFDGIIDHVDGYLHADRALGGDKPSAKARSYIEAIRVYELTHGARPKVVKAIEDRLTLIDEALAAEPGAEAPAVPWDGYTDATADTIIDKLRKLADTDPEEARALIELVETFEGAHKARKGVLNRLAGLLPPPLPKDDLDDDLELDKDLEDALDKADEDTTDDDLDNGE